MMAIVRIMMTTLKLAANCWQVATQSYIVKTSINNEDSVAAILVAMHT